MYAAEQVLTSTGCAKMELILLVLIVEEMLQKARDSVRANGSYKGDATRAETFPPKSYSHALMLYFSIYQFQNPKMVLDNVYSWLRPGGILVYIWSIPTNSTRFLMLLRHSWPSRSKKYSKERVIDSDIFFDKFKYKSRFVKDPDTDDARFEEVFEFDEPER